MSSTGAPPEILRLPADARLGHFELQARLATGRRTTTFLARASGDAEPLALRVPHDDANGEAFVREHRARPVLVVGDPEAPLLHLDGRPAAAARLLVGESLATILSVARAGRTPMPPPLALALIQGTIERLLRLGDDPVHGDLTPAHVVVGYDGTVELIDPAPEPGAARTDRLQRAGYPLPEKLEGRPLGPASDVFSLGTLLFELLTAQRLFAAETIAEQEALACDPGQPRLREVGVLELRMVLRKMLRPSPAARFSDAAAARDALRLSAAPKGLASPGELGAWLGAQLPERHRLWQSLLAAPPAPHIDLDPTEVPDLGSPMRTSRVDDLEAGTIERIAAASGIDASHLDEEQTYRLGKRPGDAAASGAKARALAPEEPGVAGMMPTQSSGSAEAGPAASAGGDPDAPRAPDARSPLTPHARDVTVLDATLGHSEVITHLDEVEAATLGPPPPSRALERTVRPLLAGPQDDTHPTPRWSLEFARGDEELTGRASPLRGPPSGAGEDLAGLRPSFPPRGDTTLDDPRPMMALGERILARSRRAASISAGDGAAGARADTVLEAPPAGGLDLAGSGLGAADAPRGVSDAPGRERADTILAASRDRGPTHTTGLERAETVLAPPRASGDMRFGHERPDTVLTPLREAEPVSAGELAQAATGRAAERAVPASAAPPTDARLARAAAAYPARDLSPPAPPHVGVSDAAPSDLAAARLDAPRALELGPQMTPRERRQPTLLEERPRELRGPPIDLGAQRVPNNARPDAETPASAGTPQATLSADLQLEGPSTEVHRRPVLAALTRDLVDTSAAEDLDDETVEAPTSDALVVARAGATGASEVMAEVEPSSPPSMAPPRRIRAASMVPPSAEAPPMPWSPNLDRARVADLVGVQEPPEAPEAIAPSPPRALAADEEDDEAVTPASALALSATDEAPTPPGPVPATPAPLPVDEDLREPLAGDTQPPERTERAPRESSPSKLARLSFGGGQARIPTQIVRRPERSRSTIEDVGGELAPEAVPRAAEESSAAEDSSTRLVIPVSDAELDARAPRARGRVFVGIGAALAFGALGLAWSLFAGPAGEGRVPAQREAAAPRDDRPTDPAPALPASPRVEESTDTASVAAPSTAPPPSESSPAAAAPPPAPTTPRIAARPPPSALRGAPRRANAAAAPRPIRIRVLPESARIVVDGTPVTNGATLDARRAPMTVTVTAAGYETRSEVIRPGRTGDVLLFLKRER
jgi:hypothetical protein